MIKVRDAKGEYPCYLCEASLNSKKDLRLHTISCHKGDEHKSCPDCEITFKDISSVRRHIKTVHRCVKQFVCSFCEKKYSHKFDLENHFRKNHSQVYDDAYKMCTECKYAVRSSAELKAHMLEKHNIATNNIKCPFCMKIFFDPIYVKQHCKRVHGNATRRLFICKFCCLVSESAETHEEHMRLRHSWECTYFCSRKSCEDYFQSADELAAHIDSHPMQTIWTIRKGACEKPSSDCDRQFESSDQRNAHLAEAHSSGVMETYQCAECDVNFGSGSALAEHECNKASTSAPKKIRLTPVCYEETAGVYGGIH